MSVLKVIRSWRDLPVKQLEQLCQDSRDVEYLRLEFFRVEGAICCLWIDQDRCVSLARLEPWRDGFLLTGLETAVDRRKCGYASSLLMEICAYLKTQGAVRVYSHIGKGNTASIRTHEACGFCKTSDMAAYVDGSVDGKACTYTCNL